MLLSNFFSCFVSFHFLNWSILHGVVSYSETDFSHLWYPWWSDASLLFLLTFIHSGYVCEYWVNLNFWIIFFRVQLMCQSVISPSVLAQGLVFNCSTNSPSPSGQPCFSLVLTQFIDDCSPLQKQQQQTLFFIPWKFSNKIKC